MDYNIIAKDFAERTKKILDNYKGEYEVTMLVNCCLGLLVVPKEKYFERIPEKKVIPEEGELWGLSRQSVTTCPQCGYGLRNVIRRIRNGICHFNIQSIPDEKGDIRSLEIKDGNKFKVELSVDNLRTLVDSLHETVYKS